MKRNNRQVRKCGGFTFENERASVDSWLYKAESFYEAAIVLKQSGNPKASHAYFYNAAIAIELIMKTVLVSRGQSAPDHHKLLELAQKIDLSLSKAQMDTLELLSELVIWSGRYPVPKNDDFWHKYHDVIQEKHIVRKGNCTLSSSKSFPSVENLNKIWEIYHLQIQEQSA